MKELEEFIDTIYESKLEYEKEFELDNGMVVWFVPSYNDYKNEFEVSIVKDDEEIENWTEFYPIKKTRAMAKKELINKINKSC